MPALAPLPCMCVHVGLSSAGDPERGMQQPLSKCRVTSCVCLTGQRAAGAARAPKWQPNTHRRTRKPMEEGWSGKDAMKGPCRMTVHRPKMSVGKTPLSAAKSGQSAVPGPLLIPKRLHSRRHEYFLLALLLLLAQ